MKYLLLAVALVATCAAPAMAQEPVRVFVSPPEAVTLSAQMEVIQAKYADDPRMVEIRDKLALLTNMKANLEAERSQTPPEQNAHKERVIAETAADVQARMKEIETISEGLLVQELMLFMEKIEHGVGDYLAANRSVGIVEYVDPYNKDGFAIVRNPAYDITPEVLEIMKSGAAAFKDTAPGVAPRMFYIDYKEFEAATNINVKWRAEVDASAADFQQTREEAMERFAENLRRDVADFLKTDPSGGDADVIRFHNFGDIPRIRLATSGLDLTYKVADAYRAAKGL